MYAICHPCRLKILECEFPLLKSLCVTSGQLGLNIDVEMTECVPDDVTCFIICELIGVIEELVHSQGCQHGALNCAFLKRERVRRYLLIL